MLFLVNLQGHLLKNRNLSLNLSPIDEKYVKSTSSTNPRADLHVTEKIAYDTRDDVYGLPPAFDQEDNPSSSLEPGIHLFWALPDALMRGQREVSRETDEYLQLDDEIPTEITGSRTGISYGDAIRESLEFEVEDESGFE